MDRSNAIQINDSDLTSLMKRIGSVTETTSESTLEWLKETANQAVTQAKRESGIQRHNRIDYKMKNYTSALIRNRYVSLWKDQGTDERFRYSKNMAESGRMKAKPFFINAVMNVIENAVRKLEEVFSDNLTKI